MLFSGISKKNDETPKKVPSNQSPYSQGIVTKRDLAMFSTLNYYEFEILL